MAGASCLPVLQKALLTVSVPQLPHHHLSEPAFRKLVEDALGQAGTQLCAFQENFEKVLPPPTAQVSVPPHQTLSTSSPATGGDLIPFIPFLSSPAQYFL